MTRKGIPISRTNKATGERASANRSAGRPKGSKNETKRMVRERPRDDEFQEMKSKWEKRKREHALNLESLYGKKIEGFDLYGAPLVKGGVSERDVPGEDVRLGLERAAAATGDPIFVDALAALKSYGLSGGKPRASYKAARSETRGDLFHGYLENMKWFIDHRRHSVRKAAEYAASHYFVNGDSFETVVSDLRERFAVWKKEGFPQKTSYADGGDLGYWVRVRPCPGRRVTMPNTREAIPEEGVAVPFTQLWRRLFNDGAVSISRVRDTSDIGGKQS